MIRIGEFIIEPDTIDYRVGIIKVSDKGKEYNKLLGYYKNVESCIKAIRNFVIHEKMGELDIDSLDDIVKAIENINLEFEAKLQDALSTIED